LLPALHVIGFFASIDLTRRVAQSVSFSCDPPEMVLLLTAFPLRQADFPKEHDYRSRNIFDYSYGVNMS
jgi:hypothetical protein